MPIPFESKNVAFSYRWTPNQRYTAPLMESWPQDVGGPKNLVIQPSCGWLCPVCGRVFGPAVTECGGCNQIHIWESDELAVTEGLVRLMFKIPEIQMPKIDPAAIARLCEDFKAAVNSLLKAFNQWHCGQKQRGKTFDYWTLKWLSQPGRDDDRHARNQYLSRIRKYQPYKAHGRTVCFSRGFAGPRRMMRANKVWREER